MLQLIPAGTFAVYGDYVIHPCGRPDMDNPNFMMPCRNILNEEHFIIRWASLLFSAISFSCGRGMPLFGAELF